MAAERAAAFTKRSIKRESKLAALKLAISMLDLTTLEGADTPEKVRSLCRKAVRVWERDEEVLGERLPSAAAVCVYPSMVGVAREALEGGAGILPASGGAGILPASGVGVSPARVKIASVATGFPSGQYPLSVRLDDVRCAIEAGADEIDMVINRGAFLAGRYGEVMEEIGEVAGVCLGEARRHEGTEARSGQSRSVHLKVILETGELATLDNVRRASDLAIAALSESGIAAEPGAAFIKTSTGKVSPAATMPVTLVMLEAIRDHYLRTGEMIGMKPAGGIRAAKQAVQYLVMVKETMGEGTEARRHEGTERGGDQKLKAQSSQLESGISDLTPAISDFKSEISNLKSEISDPESRRSGACGVSSNPWLSSRLFRFGASSLANDLVRQVIKQTTGGYAAAYDVSEA
jgi:deoxyribose-phosphate aldolase